MIFSVSTILLCTLDAAYQNIAKYYGWCQSTQYFIVYTHETTKGRSFLVFVYSENNHYS